jgi:D-threo-aldose 1-dehydrogenase
MTATVPIRPVGRSGLDVSELALGAAPLGNLYEPVTDAMARSLIDAALQAGITYFDTAPFYGFGLSERRVGDGLRGHSHAIVSTKVGRLLVANASIKDDAIRHGFRSAMPFEPVFDYTRDGILRSWEASVHRLGLAHIDILYIHDIGIDTHGPADAEMWAALTKGGGLRALETLRSEGSIRAFGIGVNESAACLRVMEHTRVDAVLLAGRYTLLEQGAMDRLLPACLSAGTTVIVGAPYNSGILALGTRSGRIPNYNYQAAPPHILARVARIESICDRHAIPLSAAALQFPLAHPQVASVVAGVASLAQFQTTLHNYGLAIPLDFWTDLKSEGLIHADSIVPRQQPPAEETTNE